MTSSSITLSLIILCSWHVTANPAKSGDLTDALTGEGTFKPEPRSNSSGDPVWPEPRAFSSLVDQLGVNRQSDVPLDCGSYKLSPGQTVTIESENYPGKHPRRHTCKWRFQGTSADSTISIACNDFRLQGWMYGCLQLKGAGLRTKLCRKNGQVFEESNDNKLVAIFKTKWWAGYGFQCTVTASGDMKTTTNADTSESTSNSISTSTTPSPNEGGCKCGQRNPVTRIVGGQETTVLEYPWQVGLTGTSNRPYCGGSIIGTLWILTAAHCVESDVNRPSRVYVVIGEHDYTSSSETTVRQKIQASKIIVHAQYNSNTYDNDIALIQLSQAITFPSDNEIAPICLPTSDIPYSNVDGIVTGWGTTSSGGSQPNVLQEVTVPTMTNSQCKGYYSSSSITNNMICAGLAAGGKDSCQGDSGGPFITDNNGAYSFMVQIGIVSWGYGCAMPNYPGVYTRVTKYISWINTQATGLSTCPSP